MEVIIRWCDLTVLQKQMERYFRWSSDTTIVERSLAEGLRKNQYWNIRGNILCVGRVGCTGEKRPGRFIFWNTAAGRYRLVFVVYSS